LAQRQRSTKIRQKETLTDEIIVENAADAASIEDGSKPWTDMTTSAIKSLATLTGVPDSSFLSESIFALARFGFDAQVLL